MKNANAQIQVKAVDRSLVEQLLAMRETEKAIRDRLTVMEEATSKAEKELMAQMDAGLSIQGLPYELKLQETARRYPSWKNEFIDRLGKEKADAVLEATTPTISRKLVVTTRTNA